MDTTFSMTELSALPHNKDEENTDVVIDIEESTENHFQSQPQRPGAQQVRVAGSPSLTCSLQGSRTNSEETHFLRLTGTDSTQYVDPSLNQVCEMSSGARWPPQSSLRVINIPAPQAYQRWHVQSRSRYLDQGRIGLRMIRPSVTYAGKPVQNIHLVNGVRKLERLKKPARTRNNAVLTNAKHSKMQQ